MTITCRRRARTLPVAFALSLITFAAPSARADDDAAAEAAARLAEAREALDARRDDLDRRPPRADLSRYRGPEAYPTWRHEIIARTGDLGITTIRPFPSVNDEGLVAFTAAYEKPDGVIAENGFVYHPTEPPHLRKVLKDFFALDNADPTPWQTFSHHIQINNANEVVNRHFLMAVVQIGPPFGEILDMPLTYLEAWDPSLELPHQDPGGDLLRPVQYAGGDAGIGPAWPLLFFLNPIYAGPPTPPGEQVPTSFVPESPLAGVRSRFSINNNGNVVFVGLGQDIVNYLVTPVLPPYLYNFHLPTGDTTRDDLYPVMADDDTFVVYERSDAQGHIRRYSYELELLETIAGPPFFSAVGRRPAISDDGRTVVFHGFASDEGASALGVGPGPGIFASWDGQLTKVAGVAGDDHLDPGEWRSDTALEGYFDSGEPIDLGQISAYEPDARVCVNNEGELLFIAYDLEGRKSVFTSRINLEGRVEDEDSIASEQSCVLSVGDVVTTEELEIEDVALNDSLTNGGEVGLWERGGFVGPGQIVSQVRAAGGTVAIIKSVHIRKPVILIPGFAGSILLDEREDPPVVRWPTIAKEDIDELAISTPLAPSDMIREFDLGTLLPTVRAYDELARTLREDAAYTEYVVGDADDRTRLGWDTMQDGRRPNMFVFAYDWRLGYVENAERLREYVLGIRDMYRRVFQDASLDPPFHIIAHSMGGIVARRYIIDNPTDHGVERVVTIGSPIVGTAHVPYIFETGRWLPYIGRLTYIQNATKAVAIQFAGAAEAAASKYYFSLGGRPFEEDRWDINGNGVLRECYTDHSLFVDMLNLGFPTAPDPLGDLNEAFHTPAQDDWSSDFPDIAYLHFVGLQRANRTIRKVIARRRPVGDSSLREFRFTARKGRGDETVPFLSAVRRTTAGDLNAPGATVCALLGERVSDGAVEHVELARNDVILEQSRQFLRTGRAPRCTTPIDDLDPCEQPIPVPAREDGPAPLFFVQLAAVDRVIVTDAVGASTLEDGDALWELEDVRRFWEGAESVALDMPADQEYTIDFTPTGQALTVEVTAGVDEASPSRATRFLDVAVTPEAKLRLTLEPGAAALLELDADGDGSFDEVVAATAEVAGPEAADITAPFIAECMEMDDGVATIELIVRDEESDVAEIRYSIDDGPRTDYTGPIVVDQALSTTLYTFATDGVGNRSGLGALDLAPRLAADVTSGVTIDFGGLRFDRGAEAFVQRVRLTNGTGTAIDCPVSFVLDDLDPDVTILNADGVTEDVGQPDSPYITVDLGADVLWTSGEQLELDVFMSLPAMGPGSYDARILGGPGDR